MESGAWPAAKRYFALLTVGFLTGATLSWGLAGLESGSKADWFAAGGTWVIGIAACALTFLQIRSALVAKYANEVRQLRVMSVQARSLCVIVKRLIAVEDEQLRYSSPRIVIGTTEQRCSKFHLDLALVDTDDELELAVSSFDYHVMAVQSLCASILEVKPIKPDAKLSEINEYKWAREQAESLLNSAEKLEAQIRRKLDSIKLSSSWLGI